MYSNGFYVFGVFFLVILDTYFGDLFLLVATYFSNKERRNRKFLGFVLCSFFSPQHTKCPFIWNGGETKTTWGRVQPSAQLLCRAYQYDGCSFFAELKKKKKKNCCKHCRLIWCLYLFIHSFMTARLFFSGSWWNCQAEDWYLISLLPRYWEASTWRSFQDHDNLPVVGVFFFF